MINISSLKPTINIRPPKIVIYGTSKIGKSTFASQAPNPIVLDLESGMDSFNITKYKVKTFCNVIEFMRALYKQDHDYQYLIVDSIDWLEKMMIQELCQQYNATNLSDKNCKEFLYQGADRLLLNMWNQFIVGLDFLNQEKNMGIILIAHPQIKKFEDPLAATYDQYSIKLEKKSAERIKEWVDCILFATLKVKTEKEKQGFGAVVNRGTGSERVIYTEKRPSFEAGNRFKLPFEITLSWNAFHTNFNKYIESLQKLSELPAKKILALPTNEKEETKVDKPQPPVKEIPKVSLDTSQLIAEHQVNFIKRLVTPERLLKVLQEYKLTRLEEMSIKEFHALNDQLRLESLPNYQPKQEELPVASKEQVA